ncbi:hypothetical protein [Actinophytocola oryzae]|nr:hypothetical protein [Actinophytocola oryzae]
MLGREGHPLGIRRAEATKAATEEHVDSAGHKRWTLGVAAGALLMAGTFAAGALGITGGAAPTAGSAPEHAPAAPGHAPGSGPVIGAPASTHDDRQQPKHQQAPDQQVQPTTPASAGGRQADTPVTGGTGSTGSTGTAQGGGSASGGNHRTTTPNGSNTQTPPPSSSQSEQPAPPAQEQQQGPVGGLVDTVGDVLSPVTGTLDGILSPKSTNNDASATRSTPSGPALTMIDPLGDLLAVG